MLERTTTLFVTKGAIVDGVVIVPTLRAVAVGSQGDAAQLTFIYRGDTDSARPLASGQLRRQLGLKLRAQDSCNVLYLMWRLDPAPTLEVSIKYNPGKHTHAECGAAGYAKVDAAAVPAFAFDATHVLRAEIANDELHAWIDGHRVLATRLPPSTREIAGPAGVRSDNVKFDLVELAAPTSARISV